MPADVQQHPLATALRAAFATHRDAVLQAPTGAGKSTIVPLALLAEPWLTGRKILMLEPRRLAARAVAQRMAATLGEAVGATVGYRMRLDTRVGRATRIEVITEGVLTRMLQSDPALEDVACLIFDEYHERSLQADLGLALALEARTQLSAQFRVLIMSATLDGQRVATLLDDAPLVTVPGRSFPVDIHYLGRGAPLLPGAGRATGDSPERQVSLAVRRALDETQGDLLVFLPGGGEIRRVQNLLEQGALPQGVRILPLYGELPAERQDAALEPIAGLRRIVLATNIAETSLTIPGITVVIDGGLVRRAHFDPATGMSRLDVERISRASAEQRAGRAGRTAPGSCYRLWSEGAHTSLAAQTTPEILEADLAPLALELANWNIDDATRLRWLDAPPAPMLAQARELLQRLEALDAAFRITAAGRELAGLPLHPRLAHMLSAARAHQAVPLAASLAALLSDRDLMRRGVERDPDVRTRLDLLRRGFAGEVDAGALQRVRRSAEQLARQMGAANANVSAADTEMTGVLLALAFPDRIGQRREGADGRYLLANGRGAAFNGASSLARAAFIVAVELDDAQREARIDLAAPLSREEIEQAFATQIITAQDIVWDTRLAAVSAHRRRSFGALLLEDQVLTRPDPERVLAAMLAGVRQLGIDALPWERDARNFQARSEFVRQLPRKDVAGWPAGDDATLLATVDEWLAPWLEGCTRREHLVRLPLLEALQGRLSHAQRQQLDQLAPREVAVPSGSRIRIDYLDDNAPCIAVRLQEVFGLTATPRIGGGTVPITLQLLSPAQRPVQITRDLAGFWQSSYIEVRKDMRGRYPKHHWPENPLEAAPSRGAKRRR